MYRRWVGVLLSLLIPGAGIYLAGNKSTGLRWFLGLLALGLANEVLTPLPPIPGIFAWLITGFLELALTCWMLVRSFCPVPKMRFAGWLILVALACTLGTAEWIVGGQFTRAFRHPTSSMMPTLIPGDRVFVNRFAYWFAEPKRGDIIVFRTDSVESLPKGQFFVKRIAALPNEKVEIQTGRLLVEGTTLVAPAILTGENFKPPMDGLFPTATNSLVVPEDAYFVVGDNPTNSRDSRDFGPIPHRSIVGKVTKIFWPLSRIRDVK